VAAEELLVKIKVEQEAVEAVDQVELLLDSHQQLF